MINVTQPNDHRSTLGLKPSTWLKLPKFNTLIVKQPLLNLQTSPIPQDCIGVELISQTFLNFCDVKGYLMGSHWEDGGIL